jgi:hypothetical protein
MAGVDLPTLAAIRAHEHPNDDAIRSSGGGTQERRGWKTGKLQRDRSDEARCKKSAGLYNFRYTGATKLMTYSPKYFKMLVDVTGIEPVTPCLQSAGVASNKCLVHFNR